MPCYLFLAMRDKPCACLDSKHFSVTGFTREEERQKTLSEVSNKVSSSYGKKNEEENTKMATFQAAQDRIITMLVLLHEF